LFNTVLDYLSPDDEMKVVDLTTTTKTAIVDTVTTAEEILDFQQLIRMVPLADSVRAMPWNWCAPLVPPTPRPQIS